jgi:tetratricopeptide (TPR) repeat protein
MNKKLGILLGVVTAVIGLYALLPAEKMPEIPQIPGKIVDQPVRELIQKQHDLLVADPTSAKNWADLGMALHAHVHPGLARECYRGASVLSPKEGKWLYGQALLIQESEREEAVALYQKALDRGFSKVDYLIASKLRLANLLEELGKSDRAEKLYMQVIEQDPRNGSALFGMANLGADRGEELDAIPVLTRLGRDPYVRRKATSLLARIQQRRNNLEQAKMFEAQAASYPPDGAWPDPFEAEVATWQRGRQALIESIAQAELRTDFQTSIATAEKLVKLYPEPVTRMLLGKNLIQANQDQRGVELLREVAKDDPKLVIGLTFLGIGEYRLARQAEKSNQLEQAKAGFVRCIETLESAVKMKLQFPPVLQYYAEVLKNRGRKSDAILAYRELLELRPDSFEAYFDLAQLLDEEGRRTEARQELEKGLQLQPDHPQGLELQAKWKK